MPARAADLPGRAECCWVDGVTETRFPPYRRSGRTTVAVVGGGIVGLTAAYLLAKEGIPVTVLEARRIGRQVTGRSTAKITSQHSLIYGRLIASSGLERARLYAQANQSAVEWIRQCVAESRIACDLQRKDAYAYTCRPARVAALEREADAARRLGLDADVVSPAPLPFATAGALRFRDQAQFNPTRYLLGLASAVIANGGRVFEMARVTRVRRGKRWRVESGPRHLDAEHVVVATNLPIAGPVNFDELTQPRSHIAMAFRTAAQGPLDGMFIDIDRPTHSLRMGFDRDGPLLIVLGAKFRTGQEGDVAARLRQLEQWVRTHVSAGDVEWRWMNEDYDSPDRIPFAGELRGKARGMYVATGFNAWGISNGTAAAMAIVDEIQGRDNPWSALYDPLRRTARHFNRGGDSRSLVRDVARILPGEGGVVRRGREKIAVWKAIDGRLHALSASCTHMGCTVTWNNAERTWDCPCHGSMFACDGEVIHGPATEPLRAKKLARVR